MRRLARSIALATAATVTLAACTGLPARRPAPAEAAIPLPAGWRNPALAGEPVAARWWTTLGDAALDTLVERALARNDDIAIAAARVEEARAAEALARAQLLPNVTLAAPGAYAQTLSPFGTPSRGFAAQPQVSISYDTDLFGRLRKADRAAAAQLLASEGAADTVRLAVAAQVATSYITLRALDARLAIARATLADRASALHIAQRRFETGYSSRLEYRQAQAEYDATAQLVPAAQLAITRAEDALSVLVGDPPRAIERGLPLERIAPPVVPAGLPSALLRRRPDLFRDEQALVAADAALDSQRAAFLPQVSLTASGGAVVSSLLGSPVGLFSLGGSVLAPLFDGGRLRAQERGATARRDQAAFAYRRTALTAFREVEDALAGVQRTGEQAAALADQASAAGGALQNATNRYRAGYSAYIEQLDAQRSLLSAELSLVQARADRLTSAIALFQALGGGWDSGNR